MSYVETHKTYWFEDYQGPMGSSDVKIINEELSLSMPLLRDPDEWIVGFRVMERGDRNLDSVILYATRLVDSDGIRFELISTPANNDEERWEYLREDVRQTIALLTTSAPSKATSTSHAQGSISQRPKKTKEAKVTLAESMPKFEIIAAGSLPDNMADSFTRIKRILTRDGAKLEIGELYTDRNSRPPRWISVSIGTSASGRSLVPIESARIVGADMQVPYSEEQIRKATELAYPILRNGGDIKPLLSHYNLLEVMRLRSSDIKKSDLRDSLNLSTESNLLHVHTPDIEFVVKPIEKNFRQRTRTKALRPSGLVKYEKLDAPRTSKAIFAVQGSQSRLLLENISGDTPILLAEPILPGASVLFFETSETAGASNARARIAPYVRMQSRNAHRAVPGVLRRFKRKK